MSGYDGGNGLKIEFFMDNGGRQSLTVWRHLEIALTAQEARARCAMYADHARQSVWAWPANAR